MPAPVLSVIIRCDGAADIGLGHIVRCIALADELRDQQSCDVCFLIRRGNLAIKMAQMAGYVVMQPAGDYENDRDWISRVIFEQRPTALIMDFRENLSPDAVQEWRQHGVLTVSIDDLEDKRLACDLVFSPPIPQVRRVDWSSFTGELYAGWEWVVLRRQFAHLRRQIKRNSRPVILVTMGGSDPAGMTLTALKSFDLIDDEFDTIVVLGSAFCHNDSLEKLLAEVHRPIEIRRNVKNMADAMSGADLAVASFCMTAYELATAGVPGIFFCLTEDHAESAWAFVDAGIGISLGVFDQANEETLAKHISLLLRDSQRRLEMAERCQRLSDGNGTRRIANVILRKTRRSSDRVYCQRSDFSPNHEVPSSKRTPS